MKKKKEFESNTRMKYTNSSNPIQYAMCTFTINSMYMTKKNVVAFIK